MTMQTITLPSPFSTLELDQRLQEEAETALSDGRYEAALEMFRRLHATLKDKTTKDAIRTACYIARCLTFTGESDLSWKLLDETEKIVVKETRQHADLIAERAMCHFFRREYDAAKVLYLEAERRLLKFLEKNDRKVVEQRLFYTYSHVKPTELGQKKALLEAILSEDISPSQKRQCRGHYGYLLAEMKRYDEAIPIMEEVLREFELASNVLGSEYVLHASRLAAAFEETGRLVEAEAIHEKTLRICEITGEDTVGRRYFSLTRLMSFRADDTYDTLFRKALVETRGVRSFEKDLLKYADTEIKTERTSDDVVIEPTEESIRNLHLVVSLLIESFKCDKALEKLGKAAEMVRGVDERLYVMVMRDTALVHIEQKEFAKAREIFERVILPSVGETDVGVKIEYGQTFDKTRSAVAKIAYYEEILTSASGRDASLARRHLANLISIMGKHKRAAVLLRESVSEVEEQVGLSSTELCPYLEDLGYALLHSREIEEAKEVFEHYLRIKDGSPRVYLGILSVYREIYAKTGERLIKEYNACIRKAFLAIHSRPPSEERDKYARELLQFASSPL